ncbi:MAG: ABC transporter permease [Chloroflexota bacterium]|nr:MAG: ABC transporter permease [Chloroflexota bacterium]
MSTIAREVRASYAFVERNINLTKRYWGWEIAFLVYSVAHALVIGFIGAAMNQISGQTGQNNELVLYLLIGSLVWSYLATTFDVIAEMISWERWEGTIEYTFMAPVSRVTHLLGQVIFAAVYGLLRTGVILLILRLFFDLDLTRANLFAAVVMLMVAAIGFVGLGIMVATLPLLFTERGQQMVFVSQSCILLVSGVFYPVDVMPGWMQLLSRLSPATYALVGVRRALLEGAPLSALVGELIPLFIVGAVAIPLGLAVFGWAERYSKRTGRLKRSG